MEEDIQKQIIAAKEEAHDETIWGKPANDIITGIGNNSGVRPQRAIWEMVQNARDVSLNGKADIVFERQHDCFIFQHNGISFTNNTLEALILQTSSKVRNDSVQVGQYGTGFLTTHKLGLKFTLSSSVQLLENEQLFHHFSNFLIDRSSTDKKQMRDSLKKQIKITEEWARNPTIVSGPSSLTTFRYIQEHEVEKMNTKEAFKASSALAPYVIALNPCVNSISFVDNVEDCKELYIRKSTEIINTCNFYNVVKVTIDKCETESCDFTVLMLQSKETVEESGEPKVIVILPIKELESKSVAFALSKDVPNLFIYLPLLGTEQWGLNFIFHSPLFTCDKDSRDSLRFVGNGQNNDVDAERNKGIIQLADVIVSHYITENLSNIQDCMYLAKVAFNLHNSDEALANYYKSLQSSWVKKYESFPFVITKNGNIITRQAKVFDKELFDACLENKDLLTAVYNVTVQIYGTDYLPLETNMLFWSETLLQWYEAESFNPHLIHLSDIVEYIDKNNITTIGEENLWCIDNYIANSKQIGLFTKYKLLPTKNGELRVREDLLNPIIHDESLLKILDSLLPNDVASFIHTRFVLFEDVKIEEYDHNKVKESMRLLVSELSDLQKGHEIYRTNILAGLDVDSNKYEQNKLSDNHINALMGFYAYIVNIGGEAFQYKMIHLLADFYNIDLKSGEAYIKEIYDWRTVAPLLIKDALFRFTLMDSQKQAENAEWVRQMVIALYNYSDYRTYLDKYTVYPNEMDKYCYSKKISKSVNITNDLIALYDKIVNNENGENMCKSIKCVLLKNTYNDYFVENATIEGSSLAEKIMLEIKREGAYPDISANKWKQQILDIIAKQDKDVYWASIFGEIDSSKGAILLSVIQEKEKKDSILSLIRVSDTKKLKALAEVAEDDNLARIIELGKAALRDEMNSEADFEYKKKLGEYVEELIRKEIDSKLKAGSHIMEVLSQQDGQDIIILLDGTAIYYIEVKSRWSQKDSVLMSALQFRTSVEEKTHYALCEVDMITYNRENVDKHEFPDVEETINRISAIMNIGVLNETLKDTLNQDSDQVHVGGDYKVVVPQTVWEEHGKHFNELVEEIKKIVEEKL